MEDADAVSLGENKLFSQLRRASRAITNIYNLGMPKVAVATKSMVAGKELHVKVTQLAVMKALYDTSWWEAMCKERISHTGEACRERLTAEYHRHSGKVVQVDLAKHLNLDCTTMCRNVKTLKSSGWVVSVRSDVNQREVLIGLTEEGRTVVESALQNELAISKMLREQVGAEFWDRVEGDLAELVPLLEQILSEKQ